MRQIVGKIVPSKSPLISSFDATIRVKRAFHPAPASRGFASHVFLVYLCSIASIFMLLLRNFKTSGPYKWHFYPLTGHQNQKVTLKVKQLSKQTETCLSTNGFSSPLLWQSLAIFDFSILHGRRWKFLGSALKRYSTAQKQVTTLTRDSRDESRVSRKETLVSRRLKKTVSTKAWLVRESFARISSWVSRFSWYSTKPLSRSKLNLWSSIASLSIMNSVGTKSSLYRETRHSSREKRDETGNLLLSGTEYVGWVCCWFSSFALRGFFSGFFDFPLSSKTNITKIWNLRGTRLLVVTDC